MDTEQVRRKLLMARAARNLSPAKLARESGVPEAALLAAEDDGDQLPLAYLRAVASRLQLPLSWFLREPLPVVLSRRRNPAPEHDVSFEMDQRLEIFAGDVSELFNYGLILSVEKFKATLPRDHRAAELWADRVRKHSRIGQEPIRDVLSFSEKYGMHSLALPFGRVDCDGAMVEVGEGVACAVINSSLKSGRFRMTVMHELGHWIFGDAYDAASEDAERMINSFSVYLLAPRAGVELTWRNASGEGRSARQQAIIVAERFGLSWSAVKAHLVHLGLVESESAESLLGEENPRPEEFVDLGISDAHFEDVLPEVSPSFRNVVYNEYASGKMTRGRALEILAGTAKASDLPPLSIVAINSSYSVNV